MLLNTLADAGFVTQAPVGYAGLAVQPTLQVASRGLHWKYDTLLMVANDADGVRSAVSRVLEDAGKAGGAAAETAAKPRAYGQAEQKEGREMPEQKPAMSFMGNNEYVLDMKFDGAGNLYLITWGHGDNLYALDPQGKLRWSRRLPEMGPCRLDVASDRVVVFTGFGSRLYQIGLDGKPISQARLPLDPGVAFKGPTYRECYTADLYRHGMGLSTELFRYAYAPSSRRVVYYEPLLETMRVLDENCNVIAEWRGESTAGTGGETTTATLGDFVCSPDGTRVAQMEDEALVLREIVPGAAGAAGSARKVAQRYCGEGSLSWRKGEPGPTVGRTHYGADLEYLRAELPAPVGAVLDLGGATGLIPDGQDLRLVRNTPEGEKEISRLGPFPWIPTFAKMSPDGSTVVLLDEYWTAYVHEASTGKRTAQIKLPEMGFVLEFGPDAKSFLIGGLRGAVMSYDWGGKPLWTTTLAAHNESLRTTAFPNVDPAIPDRTDKLHTVVTDEPGELEKLVTLDRSRLMNGDCEGAGGWRVDTNAGGKAAEPVYADGGYQGKRCLKVAEALVQQPVEGLIGEHFTWVLEFFYRGASAEKPASLLAGLNLDNRHPGSVVRVLPCDKDWKFARVVAKSGGDPKAIRVGFQGQGGEALVDNVTLRRIRFPSVNHMLHPPVYDVEPIILKNPLFMKDYNPLGVLREQIPNIMLSGRPAQIADALVVDAFMQNGRLNDISSTWHWSYLDDNTTLISMGIRNPRWVSMVAVYFNAYDEANTTPHLDVYVSDTDAKRVVRVASVRNNRSLFRLVKFPPRRADEVRLVLVNALPRQRTVTEVEVYGPLSGSEKGGFVDEAGQNTYMGSFSRVEKRRLEVAPGYEEKAVTGTHALPKWAPSVSQVLMSERNLYLSRSPGFNQRLALDSADESFFRTGGLGFGPTPTLYGGALLKPGVDGRLWCVDPESGRAFWSSVLGERLTGSPAAIGLDVLMATDAGKCYTLDIASGAILGEQKLAGPVYGSVATDGANVYVITSGGTATCFNAESGKVLWNVPIAPNTESTPAVDGGVVFMADQKGTARAVQAADGTTLWTRELGSEFCRCPVVLPERVVFGCLDGRLTALNRRTGELVWQTQVNTRFMRYDPVPMVLPPAAPVVAASNAVAEAVAAPSGPALPVLLCVSDGKLQLLDAATGQPTARQITVGSMDGKGNFKAKDGLPGVGGEVTAPIGCYTGYLAFVAVNDDRGDAPIYGLPDVYGEHRGLVKLFKPITDTPPKKTGGPRPVAYAQTPIRMDAPVGTNAWGRAILSLNGPDDLFPEDRRKKGSLDGSTVWSDFGDLGAQIYMICDSNALVVAAVVGDDKHVNKAGSDGDLFTGDCLQIGILALKPRRMHWNLGLARTEAGVRFEQAEGNTNRIETVSEFSVVRADGARTTTYKLKIPLAGLGLTPDSEFGFNVVIKDDDKGDGARYWLQAAPGLAERDDKKWPLDKTYPRYLPEK
jgi:outer membrane protein assembly factor BamB